MSVRQLAAPRLTWWRRLSLSSFALAAITILILWPAITDLLRQGRQTAVL